MENTTTIESTRLEPHPVIPKSLEDWNTLSWTVNRLQHILFMSAGLVIGNTASYMLNTIPEFQTSMGIDIVRGAGVFVYFGSIALMRSILLYMRKHDKILNVDLNRNLIETQTFHLRRREAIIFALTDYFYFASFGVTGAVLQNSGIVLLQAIVKS